MGRQCKQGTNDIQTKRPDIATYMTNYNTYHKISDTNIPEKTSHSGKDHIYLRCEYGHDFDGIANKINQRKRDENGIIYCPECHKLGIRKMPYIPRKTFKQSLYDFCIENDRQDLLNEWNYEENNKLGKTPKTIGKGSNKPKPFWNCPKGHTYDMSVSDRTEGRNCPICSGARLSVGYNDLLSQYPEVCKDWDYKKNKKRPEEHLQHSSDKVHWKCHKCGHEWEAQISHRTSKVSPTGCPKCGNHGMSRIDMCIFLSIQQYYLDAEYRKKIDGIEFDTFIPSLNFAIEYDGHFHDESRAERDARKDKKAKEKNITFLRIKETKDISETHFFKDNILYLNVKHNTKYKKIVKSY